MAASPERMWRAGWKDVGRRVGQVSPGTGSQREPSKCGFDPAPVVAAVLVPDPFRPLLSAAPKPPAGHPG